MKRMHQNSAARARKFTAAALTVSAAALALTACDPTGEEKKTSSTSYEITEKATALEVTSKGGNITVATTDGTAVKVTETLRYTDGKPKTSHSATGGTVDLTDGGCDSGDCSVDYRLEIPRSLTVTAETAGGDVKGEGLAAEITAKSAGGDISLAFAARPERVLADTAGGNVEVKVPGGTYAVTAETAGGERKVGVTHDKSARNVITARSEGGDVTVTAT
ncbi:hypothetical protein GCM10018785_52460 [Streptomyces longispororuber]|uniref:DUF4097 domain-containing protein n=1 Tax=Streptomyces longispororuber TaxID=68230 RepID=A0A918ZZ78_9ACTN|nr:DUF4097 family beta strand repeat-containing protein [Streptomyces longispororuber]GHE77710.1 hypothetical protein GCM10018785_52460 [Streptomyces longispororuber]